MRLFRFSLAVLLAAGIVTFVSAQQRQPRQGGGFGGGFGQDVEELVFTNATLQEELKVTGEQKDKFKPVTEKLTDLNKKRQEAFKGGKFDREKFTEIQEEGKKITEERKKVFDEVATADQKKRLKQIRIQQMSFRVFNDPEAKGGPGGGGRGVSEDQKSIMKEVQEAMKLSDSQKSSLKTISTDLGKETQEIYKDAGITFGRPGGNQPDAEKVEAANKKIEKVRKEAWEKVTDLFDDTQKKTWKELTGAPFDLAKLAPPRRERD